MKDYRQELLAVKKVFNQNFSLNTLKGEIKKVLSQHCRFLVPANTHKILTEIWHHYWLKNDGENWSRKNYYEIPRWPSEIPANLLGQFSLSGQQQLWRPSWNLKIIFPRPLFTIISKPKMVTNLCKNLSVLSSTRNLQCTAFFCWHIQTLE